MSKDILLTHQIALLIQACDGDSVEEIEPLARRIIRMVRGGPTPRALDAASLFPELADSGIEILSVTPIYSQRRK